MEQDEIGKFFRDYEIIVGDKSKGKISKKQKTNIKGTIEHMGYSKGRYMESNFDA